MIRTLSLTICLCASGPAAAFDLAEFIATMSMGRPATEASQPVPVTVVPQPGPAPRATPERSGPPVSAPKVTIDPDAVWMIGVFR